MRRNDGFWWLFAVAVGVGGALLPERLGGGSTGITFIFTIAYMLAGAVLVSYLRSKGAWRWPIALIAGALLAQVVLAIPASEPLSRGVIGDALLQQRANAAGFLAQAIAASVGCGLGISMSGGR